MLCAVSRTDGEYRRLTIVPTGDRRLSAKSCFIVDYRGKAVTYKSSLMDMSRVMADFYFVGFGNDPIDYATSTMLASAMTAAVDNNLSGMAEEDALEVIFSAIGDSLEEVSGIIGIGPSERGQFMSRIRKQVKEEGGLYNVR